MGLLTVEHLKLGIETYDPEVNFSGCSGGPPGGYDTSAVDRIRARWERTDGMAAEPTGTEARPGKSLAEVLASIRALVSAETEARTAAPGRAARC